MKTLLSLCIALFSCTCSTKANAACSVPDTKKSYVTTLSMSMARSVGPCVPPDPSVLLALNLGDLPDVTAQDILVDLLKKDAAEKITKNQPFSSGKVALYVLALRSSCVDPTNIPTSNGSINLVDILQSKTEEELKCFKTQPNQSSEKPPTPQTTWYQVALDVITLCVMDSQSAFSAADVLAKHITPNAGGSVDTAAVAVMAYTCVLNMTDVPPATKNSVNSSLIQLLDYILKAQKDGLVGNAYSTGLAGQALKAAQGFYPLESWNCSKTMETVLELIPQKVFDLPITAAQLLPYLSGKSYVSVKEITCSQDNAALISVTFTIVNYLDQPHFTHNLIVTIKEGENVLQVMEKAAEINPSEFSFKSKDTSFGAMITEINHLAADDNNRTYWMFSSGNSPLQEGVGQYKPQNNEHIIAVFSTY